ncbi:MAG: hypothetical protein IAG13_24510 [Deltaproteobacteria bacterium]|nr:hypothetical protein [Nannocystaceae bacterium]
MGEDPTTGGSTCGNAVIDEDEDCDGADLGAQTCESRGFPGGSLSCALDCRFDESACDVIEGCGNGTREGDEQCDQSDFGGSTCTTYSAQYGGGALMCNENCTIDPSACCVASGQNCQLSPCCAELSCSIVLDTCL